VDLDPGVDVMFHLYHQVRECVAVSSGPMSQRIDSGMLRRSLAGSRVRVKEASAGQSSGSDGPGALSSVSYSKSVAPS
jgi:hypothetical protein